jgi:hypothetical protein
MEWKNQTCSKRLNLPPLQKERNGTIFMSRDFVKVNIDSQYNHSHYSFIAIFCLYLTSLSPWIGPTHFNTLENLEKEFSLFHFFDSNLSKILFSYKFVDSYCVNFITSLTVMQSFTLTIPLKISF